MRSCAIIYLLHLELETALLNIIMFCYYAATGTGQTGPIWARLAYFLNHCFLRGSIV